jgi:predicted GH43/DUF377 family glycosyl hydrolase
MLDFNERTSGQVPLEDDTPVLDDTPFSSDYGCEVLPGEFAVVGVRSEIGDDYDIEVYTDTTYTTLIDSSNTVGDAVDFVVMDKDVWTSPPDRGVKVTSGSSDYIIEMENQIEKHPVFDSWSGSMDEIPGNPVMDVGPPGSFDEVYAYFPCVLDDGSIYHMWYSGFDGSNTKIGYANSTDGIIWTKYSGNPVLDLGLPGSWDDIHVHYPMVIWNGTGYEMWYSGNDGTNYRVGYATSPDGLNWNKYNDPSTTLPPYSESDPVIDNGGAGSFDQIYAGQASVILEVGTYHMWYSGVDFSGEGRTGYATSPDGVSWTKYPGNPVLDLGPPGSWDDFRAYVPSVVYNGTKYFMMYSGNDGSNYRIGYAISTDKINWTKSPANPTLDLGPGGSWDDSNVGTPFVLYNGTTYKMWYSGFDGTNNRVGYATIPEIDNWEKYTGNPVLDLGPGGSWEDEHVRSPSVLFDGSVYHMWYCGYHNFEWRIGYANSTDGTNWNKYPSNPVLDLGPGGSWEDKQVLQPVVLFDGSIYHMWYSGDDGTTTRRIGYANSTDGLTWNKYSGNPIINVGTSGLWDDESIYPRTVIKNGSTYQMWYHAQDGINQRIGYATSPDGLTWTKYPGNPIMDLGLAGSWEDTNVFKPVILFDGSTYQMWYGGGDSSVAKTGYATSSDGINWERYPGNPIIDVGSPGSYDDVHTSPCSVYYDGLTYHTWYTSYNGTTYRIGYAKLPWKKLSPINEVLDAYEITGLNAGSSYTINLEVPTDLDLDLFIYDSTGGRNDAVATSEGVSFGVDESITFTALTSGDYLLVVTNEEGGVGTYTITFNETSPVITNVTAIPDPQEVYGDVNISANITDEVGLYGAWVEIYDPQGGFVGNITMQYDPINGKYYWIQSFDMLGIYTFTIWANDTFNNWANASGSFLIWDTTPPMILDVMAIPDPQEVYYYVNISTNITDNYQLAGAWVKVDDPFGVLVGNFSLSFDPINSKFYWNQTYDLLGLYNFTIWANDTSNNWNSESGSFLIQDTTPPVIVNVTTIPDPQEVFFSVNISANITDNYQIYDVWVDIDFPGGGPVGNFTMSYDSLTDKYYWDMEYNELGDFTYTIWVNDTSNNWASFSSTFEIRDTTPPVIINTIVEPDPQEVYFDVSISAEITDNFQLDGEWIEIYDPDGGFVGNFSMSYDAFDRFYLIHSYDLLDQYTFTIWARDVAYNWASDSGTFVIHDTTPPVISNPTEILNPLEVFYPVNISATITENYQISETWIEIFDPDGNLLDNLTLEFDPSFVRFFINEDFDLLGNHSYKIWATDTSGNIAMYDGMFTIQDTADPVILNATEVPDPQEVFGSVNISVNITDNFELSDIWIELRNPNEELVGTYPMEYDDSQLKYFVTQICDLIGTYTYTIHANDTSDNLASYIGSFVIQDTTPPVISNVVEDPDPQIVNREFNVSAVVTDNYQLGGVWIIIVNLEDNSSINISMNFDSLNEKFYTNQTFTKSGDYEFTILATDTSGNWATHTGSFVIEPEEEPDEFNWKPVIALIFTAILLIVGIIVVYNRPMKFTGDLIKDRTYTLLAGVLPFAIAEAITGIVSFVTGLLAVPPLFGLGMMVDLTILIIGILCSIMIYKKGVPYDTYVKEEEPPESYEMPPPSTDSQPETSTESTTEEENLPPIPPPETPPSPPLPPPEENPLLPPTSPPEESPP